jgi:hypothetical protein
MNFQFDFRLEDANLEQADALLESITLWADHRNCWIAGGYHRIDTSEEMKCEKGPNLSNDRHSGPGPDPGPVGAAH